MDFGEALKALREGKCVTRAGWNGRGMYIFFVPGQEAGWIPQPGGGPLLPSRALPYLAMRTVQGDHVPWLISQTDALAMDWAVVTVSPAFAAPAPPRIQLPTPTWLTETSPHVGGVGTIRIDLRDREPPTPPVGFASTSATPKDPA